MFKDPGEVLQEWLDRLNRGDLAGVLALYNGDAVLIPTFAGELCKGTEAIRAYFEMIGARPGLGVALDHPAEVQNLSGVGILSGTYTWHSDNQDPVQSRYSFVVDLKSGQPILNHHSSQVP